MQHKEIFHYSGKVKVEVLQLMKIIDTHFIIMSIRFMILLGFKYLTQLLTPAITRKTTVITNSICMD